jgi:hypothetical protein
MTSNYRDFTSYVSTSSKANDYTSLGDYSLTGNQSVPSSSLMKLSVAPGGDKFFSTAPTFQSRLDSFRIAPPSKTPVSLGDDNASASGTMMMSAEGMRPISNGDYQSLGSSYKMNPM